MLAIVVDSLDHVNRVADTFNCLQSKIFLSAAGAPLGNGIAAARAKPALIVFEVAEHLSDCEQKMLLDINSRNISQRQALNSVNKRNGYFTDPYELTAISISEAMNFVRKLIRIDQQRQDLLPQLTSSITSIDSTSTSSIGSTESPPVLQLSGTVLLYIPSTLAAFETVYMILAHRGISPLDVHNTGYMKPVLSGQDVNHNGCLAVSSLEPLWVYNHIIDTVCAVRPWFCSSDSADEIVYNRRQFSSQHRDAVDVMGIWALLIQESNEGSALSRRAAEVGHIHAEALHMLDILVLQKAWTKMEH